MSRLDIIFVGGELNEGNYVEDFESLLFLGGLNLISCVLIFFSFHISVVLQEGRKWKDILL